MAKDMTKGTITSQLILFTIPLILGNLFQLTYNAADSVIVGKFLGDNALAAVGTAGPVMNLVILFFSGMCGNGKTTWLKAIRTLINSLNLRHPQTNSSYEYHVRGKRL